MHVVQLGFSKNRGPPIEIVFTFEGGPGAEMT